MTTYTRGSLTWELQQYAPKFPEEFAFRDEFLILLAHPDSYQRHHLPGHITASAWILNQHRSSVLLTLHAKLGKWLQPGGHADGDEDVLQVALKETLEETGLQPIVLHNDAFFDIDIHPIPARKDMPAHLHYDVRFVFQGNDHARLIITDESKDLRWFPLEEIAAISGNNQSIMRMVFKTATL